MSAMLAPTTSAAPAPLPAAGGSGQATGGSAPAAAAGGSAPTLTAAFPDPPQQFVDLFSDERLSSGLSPEPPAPLAGGAYAMFGVAMACEDKMIRSLEEQGIRRLYQRRYDRRLELKKMNHSLLASFLDLLDVLVKCPETASREEKCQHISMLFIQMHHLINELRPHQARETIRVSLLLQRKARIAAADRVHDHVDSATETIAARLSAIPDQLLVSSTADSLLPHLPSSFPRLDSTATDPLTGTVTAATVSTEDLVELDFIMCQLVLTDLETSE